MEKIPQGANSLEKLSRGELSSQEINETLKQALAGKDTQAAGEIMKRLVESGVAFTVTVKRESEPASALERMSANTLESMDESELISRINKLDPNKSSKEEREILAALEKKGVYQSVQYGEPISKYRGGIDYFVRGTVDSSYPTGCIARIYIRGFLRSDAVKTVVQRAEVDLSG